MTENLNIYFEKAKNLTMAAGVKMLEGFHSDKRVEIKTAHWDMVTEYDKMIENILFKGLKVAFPTHKFIGEESASAENQIPELTIDPTWIIDPIDGTNNFIHSFKETCISVALAVNKELVLALIYNPITKEMYTAKKGEGAFMNDKRIFTRKDEELTKALLCCEISLLRSPTSEFQKIALKRVLAGIGATNGMRSLGCAAISLCYVAKGCFDIYYTAGLKCWDIAAGALIVSEAGGTVNGYNGETFDVMNGNILATSNPTLNLKFMDVIKQADAQKLIVE